LAQSIEAAQNGVLDAILELHSTKLFPNVIDDLLNSVFPHYLTPSTSLDWGVGQGQGVVKGQASTSPSPFMSWGERPDDRRSTPPEAEVALQAWARRFRLTQDLSQTGECLPWIVEFGHELCEGRSYRVPAPGGHSALNKFLTEIVPRREGVEVTDPDTKVERRSDYLERVKDAHNPHYTALLQRLRAKPRLDKRNREHYKWFVLRVCGELDLDKIPAKLGVRIELDTVRKGIATVRRDLGLQRK
jgi:hypothetical protein